MLDAAVAPDAGMNIAPDVLEKLGRGSKSDGRRMIRTWLDNETQARPIVGPTAKPASVRIARREDENALFKLMMQDAKENASPIAQISADRILEHVQLGTRRAERPDAPMVLMGVIDGKGGDIAGCILLQFFQWWWSKAYYLQEVWNYVAPEYRKSRNAAHLMQFARWASDDMSAGFGYRIWLLQGVTARENMQKKCMFYSRFGNKIGEFYIYPHPGPTP